MFTTTADLNDQVMHCHEAQWRAIQAVGRAVDHLCITRACKKGPITTEELDAHAAVEARKQDMARAKAAVEEAYAARDAALAKAAAATTSTHTTIDPIIVRFHREHSRAMIDCLASSSLGKTTTTTQAVDLADAAEKEALRALVTAQAALRTAAAAALTP